MALERTVNETFEKEKKFFVDNSYKIEREYGRDTFVAISGNQIVGHDKSKKELRKRLAREYLKTSVYINSIATAVEEVDSPFMY